MMNDVDLDNGTHPEISVVNYVALVELCAPLSPFIRVLSLLDYIQFFSSKQKNKLFLTQTERAALSRWIYNNSVQNAMHFWDFFVECCKIFRVSFDN